MYTNKWVLITSILLFSGFGEAALAVGTLQNSNSNAADNCSCENESRCSDLAAFECESCNGEKACECNDGCNCTRCQLFGECTLGDAVRLRDSLTPDSFVNYGGWLQLGYHSHNTRLSNARGDLLAFNDVPNNLNFQQTWLYFEKKAANDASSWDVGFRFDMMYGTDAKKMQAFGNDSNVWDSSLDHGVYGWAMPQAYVQLANDEWSIIAGHFFTIVGYEVVPAPNNFFYSHALTMFNSEPFTHTGVLGTYTGSEFGTFYVGWTLGWDTGFDQYRQNSTNGSSWLGGFSTELTEGVTMTYISTLGDFGARNDANTYGFAGPSADFGYSHSLVFDFTLNDQWHYILQQDMVSVNTVGHDQIGINQYLLYKYNDCLGVGARLEWWKNDSASFYEATVGLNYKATANLIFRPEIRYDWTPSDVAYAAANGGTVYNQTTFGFDAIFTF